MICPLVAVLQWRQEIERFTPPGTLKVCQMPSSSHASVHNHMRRYLLQQSSQLPPSDPSNTNFKHLGLGIIAWVVVQVVVFHGNKRTADPAELAEADVVLTTYSIIEGEHRRYVEPDKIPCKYCNKRFQPERLEVHLRYACHPAVMPHSVPGQPA